MEPAAAAVAGDERGVAAGRHGRGGTVVGVDLAHTVGTVYFLRKLKCNKNVNENVKDRLSKNYHKNLKVSVSKLYLLNAIVLVFFTLDDKTQFFLFRQEFAEKLKG